MFVLVMGWYIHIVHVFCALQSHCPCYDSAWLIYEIWHDFLQLLHRLLLNDCQLTLSLQFGCKKLCLASETFWSLCITSVVYQYTSKKNQKWDNTVPAASCCSAWPIVWIQSISILVCEIIAACVVCSKAWARIVTILWELACDFGFVKISLRNISGISNLLLLHQYSIKYYLYVDFVQLFLCFISFYFM